jgi:spore maturation protein CgeB
MRVLILGHDEPGGLMHSYARGFEEMGHAVQSYCLATALASVRRIPSNRVTDAALARPFGRRLNEKVAADLEHLSADLVLIIKGEHLSPDGIRAIRSRLRCPVINFYPDDPFSHLHFNRLVFGPDTLRAYDACFTYSRRLARRYEDLGILHVDWLPFARDPALHAPPPDRPQVRSALVFAGNLDAERLDWLEAVADLEIEVYGDIRRNRRAIRKRPSLKSIKLHPPAVGLEMATALRRGAISLNLLRVQNKGSHNMRSFESPACGAFTLSERSDEIVELFQDDVEIVTFADRHELRTATEHWLDQPQGRSEIAAAGFERVRSDTYTQRARWILEHLSGV